MSFKLKKEFKDKWVAALRSGFYPQGKGALQNYDGTSCCLGVACIISPEISKSDAPDSSFRFYLLDNTSDWVRSMPNNNMVRLWADDSEVTIPDPWLVRIPPNHKYYETLRDHMCSMLGDDQFYIPNLNDQGVPFTVIADLIEEQF